MGPNPGESTVGKQAEPIRALKAFANHQSRAGLRSVIAAGLVTAPSDVSGVGDFVSYPLVGFCEPKFGNVMLGDDGQ